MKNILLYIGMFLFFSVTVVAQRFENYQPLVCQGEIPGDYITPSAQKYKKEIEVIKESDFNRKEAKNRKAFALQTNFVLDDLLQSGLVLFNDPVTAYLNDVLQNLLPFASDNKVKDIHVYTLRSTEVNAFATDRGDIFVTLGLLAQLENEAQLAFILAHELVHLRKGHSLDLYLESEKISRSSNDRKVLGGAVFNDSFLEKCAYSKELESEADEEGLALFLKTSYNPGTLNTVYDVLKYGSSPFDDISFDMELFQTSFFRFPEDYILKTVKAVSGEDEFADDSRSSHPNIGNRRVALKASLKDVKTDGLANFLLPEDRFFEAREIARFELPALFLHHEQLPEAVYNAWLLLKKHPDNPYLQKCIAKALYLAAKVKNSGEYSLDIDYEEVEGESQKVHYLMDQAGPDETIVLAMRYALGLQEKFPQDSEVNAIVDDLFVELATRHESLNDFPAAFAASKPAHETIDTTEAPAELSKYDKIRQQEESGRQPGGSDYWRLGFVDFLEKDGFVQGFESGAKTHKKRKELNDYFKSAEGRKKLKKEERRIKKKGHALGIDKIVVVNPYFLQLDVRKDQPVQLIRTETGQENLRHLIEEVRKGTDLGVKVLDVCDLKKSESEAFNDIRFLNEWFGEQVNHLDLSLTPGSQQAILDSIATKYGTDYFLWTGIVSLREKNRSVSAADVYAGILLWPALPFFAASKLWPRYDMLHFAMLFDVRTGKRQVLKFEYFDKKDSNDLVKAHLYDVFSQIKNDGK